MSKPEKAVIVNNFIFANFNHNPVVWHFCSGNSTKKTEKIQKRYFRILLDVYESDYDASSEKSGEATMDCKRSRTLAIEIFKTINNINSKFMKNTKSNLK